MKKVLLVIVIVIAAILLYSLRDKITTDTASDPRSNEGANFRPDPSNATFNFDDGPITLVAGRNERNVPDGGAFMEETIILDPLAYGDINADGKDDTALLLARYGGGSGTFIYLATFVSGPVTYRGSQALFLGDRISPQSIAINGGVITVRYLDREAGEAFAAEPTVAISKQFIYRDGELRER